ncbi:MAG TPA: hypothetical protein DEO32_04985 [Ruminococcaceae bacterium]|nr:hypothetical protein [Oscillospiraceae bacterium]
MAKSKISENLASWFFPKTDMQTKREIDNLNVKNIHYVSLVVGIIQLISLVFYFIINHNNIDNAVADTVFRVGKSVFLCVFGYVVSGIFMRNTDLAHNHPKAVKMFIGGYIILLIIWSIEISVYNYKNYQQLLTFYTVELLAVLFVKQHPIFAAATITGSYTVNYLILNFGIAQGRINPYNYIMLAVLSVVGALLNYRLTANYISQKNKANMLNNSLEIIANHDSITRLQNRYALNQRVPDYIGCDVCVAMGDINSFKAVNDTYGHRAGDDILKTFSDILLEFFDGECVFRYGGDEFLIIEHGADLDAFREKLNNVNKRFAAVRISNVETGFGCSFGCVKARPESLTEFFDSLTRADRLLYEEKVRIKAVR